MNIQIGDIGHIIQLAIAPVFLLTGIGTMLVVLTNRLGRIIDRTRVLEDRLDIGYNDFYMDELDTLYTRTHLINYSISLSTACGFFVCVIIAMLFLGDIMNLTLDKYIAAFFVLAVICLIGCFIYLLREIYLAARAQRIRRHIRPPR
ncbi:MULTISPECIES: DUF2721 domain-containing protein [Janthinobacterium]|jgi:hypothetical protein|uniref:DUF2721 domain-containing protein n=1 Tax=Janthinobacterium svalbardensis TaxID=368607 RepID=A0A290WQF4_9BURK|nr:DUF2721 domain-containing protein [Janthinobacterium svalbardensis]ATD59123.1 hypothetical protein CNX70_02160 [Janthinobacterium svalbardensis]